MSKPLDLEAFAAHIEAATRRAGFTVEKRRGLTMQVLLHGQPMRCDLRQHYLAYQHSPQRLDTIVDAHLSALKQAAAAARPPSEQEAAQSLLPMLQSPRWLEEMKQQKIPLPVHRPFVAGLLITYIFDLPHARAYLNEEMAAQIGGAGSDLQQIHDYALHNLRLRVKVHQHQTRGGLAETMIFCETHEGFAATSILLPEVVESWNRRIPGQLLIGIPNRDFVVAFSNRHPAGVEAIARQVQQDARQRPHPLSARLLTWKDGALREYEPLH